MVDPIPYKGVLTDSTDIDTYNFEALNRGWLSAKLDNQHNNYFNVTSALHEVDEKLKEEHVAHVLFSLIKYQQLSNKAATDNYFLFENEQLVDNYDNTLNPFEEKYFFSAFLPQKEIGENGLNIQLSDEYFFSNHEGVLSSIQFDVGNGEGYRTLSFNTNHHFSYSSTGLKTWKLKITYNVAGTLKSYEVKGSVNVKSLPCSNCRTNNYEYNDNIKLDEPISATRKFEKSNTYAKGNVYVFQQGELDKPFIIFSGFSLPELDDTNYAKSFVDDWYIDGIPESNIGVLPADLHNNLFEEGYDIIFVEYEDPGDYIQNNAFMAEEVIKWVNQNKVATADKNVVMGISMGGLIANYALRSMELRSEYHDTRLLLTMDSPHRGANVPLSVIALTKRVFEIYENTLLADNLFFSLRKYKDLLFTNSAKQMLINNLEANSTNLIKDNQMHTEFMEDYHGKGRPILCRVVALSNSSDEPLDDNWNGLLPGEDLIDVSGTCKVTDFTDSNFFNSILRIIGFYVGRVNGTFSLNLKALSSVSEQITNSDLSIKVGVLFWEKEVYHQNISYTTESGELPWDSAHGGLIGEGFGPIDIDDPILGCIDVNENLNDFCFVPQVSALNISPENSERYSESQLQRTYNVENDLLRTPFDNMFTESLGNQIHTRFTIAAGNFIWKEISDQQESTDYTKFATFISNLSINSSDCIANGSSLSLSNIPPSGLQLSYKWEVEGVNSKTLSSPNELSAYVSNVVDNNTIATIKCTITGPYHTHNNTYEWEYVVTKDVTSRSSSISVSNPPYQLCYDIFSGPDNVIGVNGLNYSNETLTLEKNSGSVNFGYTIYGSEITIHPYQLGFISFNVKSQNDCGTSNSLSFFINVIRCAPGGGGGFPFSIYPIPNNGTLNLDALSSQTHQEGFSSARTTSFEAIEKVNIKGEMYELIIIDDKGNEMIYYDNISSIESFKLNLSSLKNGFYYLKLFNQEESYIQRIEVRK